MGKIQKEGKQLILRCEYLNDNGDIPDSLLSNVRFNIFSVNKDGINYKIAIETVVNRKTIQIDAELADFNLLYSLAMDVLRFENLFDGRFFDIKSCTLDSEEYYDKVENKIIAFIKSTQTGPVIPVIEENVAYKGYFSKFNEYLKNNLLRHHVFLYAFYLMGVPADLRMAQLLEIFEPIADELIKGGKIKIYGKELAYIEKECPKCGEKIKIKQRRHVTLNEKLTALIEKYGQDIFLGDNIAVVVEKGVAVRNKVDHVSERKNAMTGIECATYLYKFSLLYRVFVLQTIGMAYKDIQDVIIKQIGRFNRKFVEGRII